ncbi:MAG: hypothetical protein WBE63_02525, partial [Acidobacteriaceae bacterium]
HATPIVAVSRLAVLAHKAGVTAADALRFAPPRLLAQNYDNPVTLDGNYLRRSDAEIFSKPKTAVAP